MDKDITQDVRIVIEFTVKNFMSINEMDVYGGVDQAVKEIIAEEGLLGIVEDEYTTLHTSIISDSDCGILCTGCFVPLTLENIGGYRCYCKKCVDAMPPLPEDGKPHSIVGLYPKFVWRSEDD